MKLDFFKMHVNGNDYLFIDDLNSNLPELDFSELAKKLCDRHFSVGADGIVIIAKDGYCDAAMRIFNADGSEAEMCGTALMCVVSFLAQTDADKDFKINTPAGVRSGIVHKNLVEVKMGTPTFIAEKKVEGFTGSIIDVGNKHFVIFVPELAENIAAEFGPKIEKHSDFPGGINVHFVKVIEKTSITMKIWERGSGETLACGTGSSAAVFAGIKNELLTHQVDVRVPGGEVKIKFENNEIYLSGKPKLIFQGAIEI